MRKEISSTELDFLLRFPAAVNVSTPVDFLSNHSWGGIKVSDMLYKNAPSPLNPPTQRSTFAFEVGVSPLGKGFFCVFRRSAIWKNSATWTEISKVRPRDGRNLWKVNVLRKRNSLRNGRTKQLCRNCA
jgi:hypothetical protein